MELTLSSLIEREVVTRQFVWMLRSYVRQGKFICIAQFWHKATHSALQEHTNYIKRY